MNIFKLLVVLNIIFLIVSCADNTKTDKDIANLQGHVYGVDEENQLQPLSGALVSVEDHFEQTSSLNDGSYSLDVELGASEEQKSLKLFASKGGFESASVNVVGKKEESVQVPDITLRKIVLDTTAQDTAQASGDAAHIEIYNYHLQHIYVLGSGLVETAKIRFIVRDAEGIPVDEPHKVKVHFSVINGPNGGEYLSPDTMTTSGGFVFTVLNSGIVAGPVHVQASADVNGQVIQTQPVRIAIYGGLPDPSHFSLAADLQNVAGLKYSGILDNITAFVGDKYSNPVAPGTVVYFSSDYGIIDGSAVTDQLGRAGVQFMTAEPRPATPWDSAYVHITGWTFKDSLADNKITSQARLLWTDQTAPISVSPTSFTYTNVNVPVNFVYTVQDIWGRPLVGSSQYKVSATEGDLFGDTDILMQDTQTSGPGSTEFSFTWAPGDSLDAPQVYINIKVTTPSNGNGYRSVNVIGTKQ